MTRRQIVGWTGGVLWMGAVSAMAAPLDCTVEWQRRIALDAAVAGSVRPVMSVPSTGRGRIVTSAAVAGPVRPAMCARRTGAALPTATFVSPTGAATTAMSAPMDGEERSATCARPTGRA